MMTTFERRQRILALLRGQSGVKVTELAELLEVSGWTIRNDLTGLEEADRLMRVRGGAVLKDNQEAVSSMLPSRARVSAPAKRRIARVMSEP